MSAQPCRACAAAHQLALNLLLAGDLLVNALLGGHPRETVSSRAARARAAGSRPAAVFCSVLTQISTWLGHPGDHCAWSRTPGTVGRELWHWSPPDPDASEHASISAPPH